MSEDKIYSVLERLPDNGQKCLCFGHKTYCCKEDMEDEPAWHEANFSLEVTSYRLKKEMPEDVEDTVLDEYTVGESWDCGPEFLDGQVIGVTKWKRMEMN